MSFILSNEERMSVTRIKKKIVGVCCDICAKKLLLNSSDCFDSVAYFEVMTGHHDWGNDSCESIQHRDICSDCINNFVRDYLSNATGTEYIEIDRTYIGSNSYEWEDRCEKNG